MYTSVRCFLGTASEEELASALAGVTDWPALSHAAAREGLLGLLATQCQGLSQLNGHLRESMQAIMRDCFTSNGLLMAEIYSLGRLFREAGVPAILLKGAGLLFQEYDRQLALRPLGDVDFLIRPADKHAAIRVAETAGYDFGDSCFGVRHEMMVDIHCDLLNLERVPSRGRAFRFPADFLWEGSIALESVEGLRIPPSEAQFVHLSVHALKHSYSRLMWLLDLALVYRRVDSDRVWAVARATGAERAVAYTMVLLREAFGIECSLPPTRFHWLERRFLRSVLKRQSQYGFGEVVTVFSIDGPAERVRYLFQLLFPTSEMRRWSDYPRRAWELIQIWFRNRLA